MKTVGLITFLILAVLIGILIEILNYFRLHQTSHYNDLTTEVQFMDHLDGYQFEDYVAWLLARNGFSDVEQTGKNFDAGLDIIAVRGRISYGFQCKHYRKRQIGRRIVRHTADARRYYGVQRVVIVTNSYFSPRAQHARKFFQVKFWDRNVLLRLINVAICH